MKHFLIGTGDDLEIDCLGFVCTKHDRWEERSGCRVVIVGTGGGCFSIPSWTIGSLSL